MTDIISLATSFVRTVELEDGKRDCDAETLKYRATRLLFEELNETVKAIYNSEFEEILDGFGDVAFLALTGIYQTFISLGASHADASVFTNEVMMRICMANLTKIGADGSVKFDQSGKVVKPEGFKPPEYRDLINMVVFDD